METKTFRYSKFGSLALDKPIIQIGRKGGRGNFAYIKVGKHNEPLMNISEIVTRFELMELTEIMDEVKKRYDQDDYNWVKNFP